MPKYHSINSLRLIQAGLLVATLLIPFLPFLSYTFRGMAPDESIVFRHSGWSMPYFPLLTTIVFASFCISILERLFGVTARFFHYGLFVFTIAFAIWSSAVFGRGEDKMLYGFYVFLFLDCLFFASTAMLSSIRADREAVE
jgi:hypothetical protein